MSMSVEKAKSDSKVVLNQASVGITQIDEAQGLILDMRSRIDLRCNRWVLSNFIFFKASWAQARLLVITYASDLWGI